MSAVLDFRELRDKVLAGEMEDDEELVENSTMTELKSNRVVLPLGLSIGCLSGWVYDRFANDGGMFGSTGGMAILTVGGLSLGYALGGLNRGVEAQTEKDRYERLLDDSQSVIEEQQEEMESMEAESEEKTPAGRKYPYPVESSIQGRTVHNRGRKKIRHDLRQDYQDFISHNPADRIEGHVQFLSTTIY